MSLFIGFIKIVQIKLNKKKYLKTDNNYLQIKIKMITYPFLQFMRFRAQLRLGGIAQLAEHRPFKAVVEGSSPSALIFF